MDMIPCKSSQVESYGYNSDTQTLRLRFVSGGVYEYDAVPLSVFDGLKCCESVGKFLGTQIKGKFKYRRVEAGGLGQIETEKRKETA